MRRVIRARVKQEVLIDSLNDSHIIGVEFESGYRCMLKKIKKGEYAAFSFTDNNGEPILYNTIQEYITIKNVEAFVFETEKEIGEWLIEKL